MEQQDPIYTDDSQFVEISNSEEFLACNKRGGDLLVFQSATPPLLTPANIAKCSPIPPGQYFSSTIFTGRVWGISQKSDKNTVSISKA